MASERCRKVRAMKNGNMKKFVAAMLMAAMAVTAVPQAAALTGISVTAEAKAKKAKLDKIGSIPVGKTGRHNAFRTKKEGTPYFDANAVVLHKAKGAKYSFKSSNTKVVKVDKKGILTGVKPGKAKITAYQTLKKKRTKVGTQSVTVKSSSFYVSNNKDATWIAGDGKSHARALETDQGGVSVGQATYYNILGLLFRNYDADYTFTTSDPENLTIAMKDESEEGWNGDYGWKYSADVYDVTAKKAGTYQVTVTETYKGKTRDLGTHDLTVFETSPQDVSQKTVYAGETVFAQSLFKHFNQSYDTLTTTSGDAEFSRYAFCSFPVDNDTYKISDTDHISFEYSSEKLIPEDDYDFNAVYNTPVVSFGKTAGTSTIQCTGKNGEDFGSVTVTTVPNRCTGIKINSTYYDYNEETDEDTEKPGIEVHVGQGTEIYLDNYDGHVTLKTQADWAAVPDVNMVSADPSIATVTYEDIKPSDDEYYEDSEPHKGWYLRGIKTGETDITITCGDQTATLHVKVSADDYDDYDDYDEY